LKGISQAGGAVRVYILRIPPPACPETRRKSPEEKKEKRPENEN